MSWLLVGQLIFEHRYIDKNVEVPLLASKDGSIWLEDEGPTPHLVASSLEQLKKIVQPWDVFHRATDGIDLSQCDPSSFAAEKRRAIAAISGFYGALADIDPLLLCCQKHLWYLEAWCMERGIYKTEPTL